MKTIQVLVGVMAFACTSVGTRSQGTFQNLGFESASPGPTSPNVVDFSAAFPGWSGYIAGVQQSAALYNLVALDSSDLSIIDDGWSSYLGSASVIDGNYTAVLQAGVQGPGNPADLRLSQTGVVPAAAQSLRFKAYIPGNLPLSVLEITLGAQQLSLTPVSSGANYTVFAADIHDLAGQTVELSFALRAENPHVDNRYLFLDSIQFSPQPIPEPSALGLAASAALMLGSRLVRQRI